MKWEIGLSTGIAYTHPIADVLPYVAESGFRTIEIATAPGHFRYADPAAVTALKEALDQYGLHVHALHAPFGQELNLTSLDPEQRRYTFDRFVVAAEALRVLGGHYLVVHPGGEDPRWVWHREERLGLCVEGLTRTREECGRRGLTLVVETPLPHLLGGQVEDLAWIMDRLPDQGVGMCLDTSHTFLGGTLFEAIDRFGQKLLHVQASDNKGHTDDHLVPGEGVIEWSRVISSLERVGYRGMFLLEVAGDGDVAEHVMSAARLLGDSRSLPAGWPAQERK